MTPPVPLPRRLPFKAQPLLVLGLVAAIAGVLVWATLSLPLQSSGLQPQVMQTLPRSGVENPVTAVVLNFRGYDTLLEIAVLLLAALGVWSLARAEGQERTFEAGRARLLPRRELAPPAPQERRPIGKAAPPERRSGSAPAGPVLAAAVRLLVPLMIFFAGYLLWIGSFAPGGAFQGGALLGGAAVLVLLSDVGRRGLPPERWLRVGLVLGLAVFVAVAAIGLGRNGHLLEYPAASAGSWILGVEAACLVSIGLTLAALFVGGRPADASLQLDLQPASSEPPQPVPTNRPTTDPRATERNRPRPNRPPRRRPRGSSSFPP
jgi:multisubunit Na+/H+ antiporter MnhB subunit